jgi:hypothetical protein
MTEYVPLLIHLANEKGLSRDEKRHIVTLELAGQENEYFGVDFVAGEWQLSDADAETKAEKFIDDVLTSKDEYEEVYKKYYEKFEETVEEKIEKHG